MKTLKIQTGKSLRGSVKFNIAEDGSLEQVIKLSQPAEEPQSIVLHTTAHGKLTATKHGLGASLFFDREKMDFETIIEKFFEETDAMAEYINSHEPEIREEIRQAFGAKSQTIKMLKGDAA